MYHKTISVIEFHETLSATITFILLLFHFLQKTSGMPLKSRQHSILHIILLWQRLDKMGIWVTFSYLRCTYSTSALFFFVFYILCFYKILYKKCQQKIRWLDLKKIRTYNIPSHSKILNILYLHISHAEYLYDSVLLASALWKSILSDAEGEQHHTE